MFVHTCSISNMAASGLLIQIGETRLAFSLRGYSLKVEHGDQLSKYNMPLPSNERQSITLPEGDIHFVQKVNSKKITILVNVPRDIPVSVQKPVITAEIPHRLAK